VSTVFFFSAKGKERRITFPSQGYYGKIKEKEGHSDCVKSINIELGKRIKCSKRAGKAKRGLGQGGVHGRELEGRTDTHISNTIHEGKKWSFEVEKRKKTRDLKLRQATPERSHRHAVS